MNKYEKFRLRFSRAISLYLLMSILTTCFSFVSEYAYDYNTIFNLISSVAFFEIFRNIQMLYVKIINKLATFTFSVYLIDVNSFFSKFLYQTLFHSNDYWNSPLMIVNLIISVIGIYIICVVMDWLRMLIFGKLFNYVVNTDVKLSEITGLKMYFFTGLNAVLYVVPCNPSCDMIYQKF